MMTPGRYQTETSDMIAVHQALLGSLDAAPVLVTKAVEDPERTDAIGSFFENVLEFLHVHHAGEDELIYPRLEERCAENKELLERIDEQHTLLYEPMEVAAAAIDAWRVDRSEKRGRSVVDAIATIDQTLRPHLSEEEVTVLPLASAWMSQEEWAELPSHAMRSFRGDKPWLSLGLIMENLGGESREAMLTRMPPERQALWCEEWSPDFDAFIADVRRRRRGRSRRTPPPWSRWTNRRAPTRIRPERGTPAPVEDSPAYGAQVAGFRGASRQTLTVKLPV